MSEKVKVTKKVAEIIEEVLKSTSFKEHKPFILYRVMMGLSTFEIEELEEGIVTVAKAIQYGYVVDNKPTEFYSFKDIAHLAMTKGVKFNLWDEEENDTYFVNPIYYKNEEGFLFESVAGGYVRNQHFGQSEMKEDKWFIVEEEEDQE